MTGAAERRKEQKRWVLTEPSPGKGETLLARKGIIKSPLITTKYRSLSPQYLRVKPFLLGTCVWRRSSPTRCQDLLWKRASAPRGSPLTWGNTRQSQLAIVLMGSLPHNPVTSGPPLSGFLYLTLIPFSTEHSLLHRYVRVHQTSFVQSLCLRGVITSSLQDFKTKNQTHWLILDSYHYTLKSFTAFQDLRKNLKGISKQALVVLEWWETQRKLVVFNKKNQSGDLLWTCFIWHWMWKGLL